VYLTFKATGAGNIKCHRKNGFLLKTTNMSEILLIYHAESEMKRNISNYCQMMEN